MKMLDFMGRFFPKEVVFILIISILIACKGNSGITPEWEWDNFSHKFSVDSVILAKGWLKQSDFGDLPSYIRIYKTPSKLQGKIVIAYIAVASIDSVTFSVLGEATGYHTLSDFYESEKSSVILNGGYFWDGSSLSLLCRGGEVLCPNNQVEYRNNNSTLYYPTRGVWGMMADESYKVDWVYTNNGVTYAYPEPADNKSGKTPLKMPSASFPEGASFWNGLTGIGGGPVLVKDSVCVNSCDAELFDSESGVGPKISNPRSAIALTSDRKIIFFVCEGREMTPGGVGLTLEEEANILLDLGCVQALNLDGGGSSCMLVNGIETIQPSDGKQRPVVTAVALK